MGERRTVWVDWGGWGGEKSNAAQAKGRSYGREPFVRCCGRLERNQKERKREGYDGSRWQGEKRKGRRVGQDKEKDTADQQDRELSGDALERDRKGIEDPEADDRKKNKDEIP